MQVQGRDSRQASGRESAGFTLVELMIAISVIAILSTIALPMYQDALTTARTQKAVMELKTISTSVDTFRQANIMRLPITLYQVGFGGRRDPWGTPYCYLNYEAGTGDGLEWAIRTGLVNPSAILRRPAAGAPVAGPSTIGGFFLHEVLGPEAPGVAPVEGAPAPVVVERTVHINVAVDSVRRRDRYAFPLNTDYDLFSIGPDRSSATSIGHALSQDDVIRANDGGFFGRASKY